MFTIALLSQLGIGLTSFAIDEQEPATGPDGSDDSDRGGADTDGSQADTVSLRGTDRDGDGIERRHHVKRHRVYPALI